jgi:hypothetical protein
LKSAYHNIIDIETYEKEGILVPYCICMIINNKEFKFYKEKKEKDLIDEVLEYFEKNKIKETIYAHNLTFDGLIIIENITKKKKIKFKAVLFRSSIYELEI